MRIKIEIYSRLKETVMVADNEKNVLDYNGNYLESNVEDFILKVKPIIDSMPNNVESKGLLDGIKYKIVCKDGEEKITKTGDVEASSHLHSLINIIEEVSNESKRIS